MISDNITNIRKYIFMYTLVVPYYRFQKQCSSETKTKGDLYGLAVHLNAFKAGLWLVFHWYIHQTKTHKCTCVLECGSHKYTFIIIWWLQNISSLILLGFFIEKICVFFLGMRRSWRVRRRLESRRASSLPSVSALHSSSCSQLMHWLSGKVKGHMADRRSLLILMSHINVYSVTHWSFFRNKALSPI